MEESHWSSDTVHCQPFAIEAEDFVLVDVLSQGCDYTTTFLQVSHDLDIFVADRVQEVVFDAGDDLERKICVHLIAICR